MRILIVCALILGCGHSPPAQFFTLSAIAPADRVAAPTAPIQVAAIHIPPALDRQEIVSESTATQLSISDQHRWGAPLDDMVRRVLTQDLAERLPPGTVIYADEPAPSSTRRLVVDILRFDADPDGAVIFSGSWSLVSSLGDSIIVSRHVRSREAARIRDYRDQAAAMSRLLGVLADSIAATLTSPPR